MSGSNYFKPVQPDIAVNPTLANEQVDAKSTSRQQKLNELKAKIASGQYSVDLKQLAQHIIEGDVLNSD